MKKVAKEGTLRVRILKLAISRWAFHIRYLSLESPHDSSVTVNRAAQQYATLVVENRFLKSVSLVSVARE